jgi:hypothetical protein
MVDEKADFLVVSMAGGSEVATACSTAGGKAVLMGCLSVALTDG